MSYKTYRQCLAAVKFLYKVTLGRPCEVEHLPFPRHRRRLPAVLSREQVAAVLGAVQGLKYRALLMTMYASGLRVSEACRLRVQDVDSPRMVLHVRDGKGGKDRLTLLSPRLLRLLRQYWKVDRPRGRLFPGRTRDGHVSPQSVRIVFRRALREAGVEGAFSPHHLRHAFATHLLEDGNRWKVMRLGAQEFIRRFLLHVLPKRFVRIRHYGLLAGRNVHGRLQQARRLLELQ